MDTIPGRAAPVTTRWSEPADAEALAALHALAWRYAYAGLIPEPGLSRMLSRRGPRWWRRLHDSGARALVIQLGDEVIGYALIGRCRSGPGAEVQELYVRPDCQGLGFGRRLFAAARAALASRGMAPLTVWCLSANRIGAAFYRALGGEVTAHARERVAGADMEKLRFTWG